MWHVLVKIQPNKKPSNSWKPDFWAKTVADIDFVYLKKRGIKNCLIDLDGTVVERGMVDVAISVIEKLRKANVKIAIATNRPPGRAMGNLKQDLSAIGIAQPEAAYAKPTRKYYDNALRHFDFLANETVMIGDRYFQDIFGANRSGLYSLLVEHIEGNVRLRDKIVGWLQHLFAERTKSEYTDIHE